MANPFGPLRPHKVDPDAPPKKRRRKKRRNDEEARAQKAFVKEARKRGWMVQHQNNGASSVARRVELHKMGCTSGAADVLIFNRMENAPGARGLALEFKSATGRQSVDQKAWEAAVRAQGWTYDVVRSCEEAIEVCETAGVTR